MKVLPLLICALALPPGWQPPAKTGTVDVEIAFGDSTAHKARCGKGGVAANTVFVAPDEKQRFRVYHCVDKELHNHGDQQGSADHGAVRVFAGQRIRWFSNTTDFRVVSLRKPDNPDHKPQSAAAPNPLFDKFDQNTPREVFSPVVQDIGGEKVVIVQLYKTTFMIDGQLVDPDVVCSM